jgi:hypothetical protein
MFRRHRVRGGRAAGPLEKLLRLIAAERGWQIVVKHQWDAAMAP